MSPDVTLARPIAIGSQETACPASAGSKCRRPLLDAALADALLSIALRGLAIRAAVAISASPIKAPE